MPFEVRDTELSGLVAHGLLDFAARTNREAIALRLGAPDALPDMTEEADRECNLACVVEFAPDSSPMPVRLIWCTSLPGFGICCVGRDGGARADAAKTGGAPEGDPTRRMHQWPPVRFQCRLTGSMRRRS